MNRRRSRKWLIWLLPVLAARAFLPVGFMLSAQADGLQLVFCPVQAPGLAAALAPGVAPDPSAHGADHAQHPSDHASHHAGGDAWIDPPCPYALAAAGMAVDVPHLGPTATPPADELFQQRVILRPGIGPVRADRIRGPPSLS